MRIAEFQRQIRDLYGQQDAQRGLERSFVWFVEECGELSRALFREDRAQQALEFADVLAWLASMAEQAGIDLEEAAQRYAGGCPRCGGCPCACGRPAAQYGADTARTGPRSGSESGTGPHSGAPAEGTAP